MQFDKSMLIDLLRQQGEGGKAEEAQRDLPDQVDTNDEGQLSILRHLGIDPSTITSLLDKIPPGLADKVPEGLKDKLPGGLGKLL